jgi:hypothetical protein
LQIKLYVLRGSTLRVIVATITSIEHSKTNLWHARLGHMSDNGMEKLIKTELLDDYNQSKLEFCGHCIFGNHKRIEFNASKHMMHAKFMHELCS